MNLIKKKIITSVLAISVAFTGMSNYTQDFTSQSNKNVNAATTAKYNYAEALQKSLFFYEVQQAGPLPEWNRVSWRADATMKDELLGGWYDAGDHMKFTLPMAYSATMMAWGLYEYSDGVEAVGEKQNYVNNLEFVLDYIKQCDLGTEVLYQIGDGGADHKWWGPVEIYDFKVTERPFYSSKSSAVAAEVAASLASGYLALQGEVDSAKLDGYLKTAKNCFSIAEKSLSDDGYVCEYYKSSHFYDELFWAANWLYMATKDKAYLDKATAFIDNLGRESQSTELTYTWGHCWDDVTQGGLLLYAINTGDEFYKTRVGKHLDYWTVGSGGKQVSYTPDGLAWLFNWGALRHATTTAFLAEVASDRLFSNDTTLYTRYTDFAESQLNYALGDNALNMSYVVGFGDKYPQHYHHRTAHASWNDLWQEGGADKPHRHVLYGALVGGPSKDGKYTDVISSYEYSEVATDYNAGYTALLCKMVDRYGGKTLSDFPEAQIKAEFIADQKIPQNKEFYMEACINQSSSEYSEIKAQATNHSAFPARIINNLSYRYFVDLTEVFDAGYKAEDIKVTIGYDEHKGTQISQLKQFKGNIYYTEILYVDGSLIRPSGQSEHQAELQFRIAMPAGTKVWDPTNDPSYEGLLQGNTNIKATDKLTMYDNGRLIYGVEPDGTVPGTEPVTTTVTTTTTTTSSTTTTTTSSTTPQAVLIYGDLNSSGKVDNSDLVALSQHLVNDKLLAGQQLKAADVTLDGIVDVADLALLKQYIMGDLVKLGK